jgi:HK97 gp10 family phage protein
MADSYLTRVKGLSELGKALKEFPDKLQEQALKGATGAAAKVVRDEARAQFTSKWHSISGRLLQNIVLKYISERSKGGRATFFVLVRKVSRKKLPKGAKRGGTRAVEGYAFYWRFLEFGTRFIAAKPFLRPAFENKYQDAIDKFRDYLRAWIEKNKGKMK